MKKILMIALVLAGFSVEGQTNFTGIYKLKEKTHVSGPEYSNALPSQMKIEQRKDSLLIVSTTIGADGQETQVKTAFAMDGKKVVTANPKTGRKYARSMSWTTDGKVLKLVTVFYLQDNASEVDFTREESWSLDAGLLMVQKKSIENNSENWEAKGTYTKE
ncbi:hypothetical protein HDC92_000948 [Pedobacter sp. AK017]|uniref:hypothetical protein n=1 Tax=Pedobacter sp. AK017 TaxID=2723073 RepID=UPI00161B54E9|nr:hypothetical protein [Pedobacter sp. AK017]MBB5437280.1 hypothetical protein [Pedobacter sp. AK017]